MIAMKVSPSPSGSSSYGLDCGQRERVQIMGERERDGERERGMEREREGGREREWGGERGGGGE